MDRRTLLKALSVSGFVAVGSGAAWRQLKFSEQLQSGFGMGAAQGQWGAIHLHQGMEDILPTDLSRAMAEQHQQAVEAQVAEAGSADPHARIRYFESVFEDDYFLPVEKRPVLLSLYQRLERLQSVVGHGNFNLLSLDEALLYARNYSRIGNFTAAEMDFVEELFTTDARQYGFYGDKVLEKLTANVPTGEVASLSGTGHYLFRGRSSEFYQRLRREVGEDIVLTSGVRSLVKQTHLFLAKVEQSDGNMSKASRSLAPPGYSYHAVGDFDVGKVGFGYRNFTDDFAETDVYKRLQDLGFVQIRYTTDNSFGVRYEPWHIQVT